MKTLEEISAKKIRDLILQKKLPYSHLEKIPETCRNLVEYYLRQHDKAICQMKIMDSLAEMALIRSEDHWAEWEKFYDEEGMRDFAEVLYIQNSGKIKKIAPWNSNYYYQHLDAYRRLNPYEEQLDDWENDVGFPGL